MSLSVIGKHKIAVDTTVLDNGDSIASYLTDAAGNLLTSSLVGGKQRLDVQSSAEYAEDSAHASGDFGSFALAVRNDTPGSMVSADGDYAPLQVDDQGRLRVLADLTAAFDFTYAEDDAFSSGSTGAYVLAVRQGTLATDTSADGDFSSFKVTNLGELYTHDTSALAQLVTANASLVTANASLSSILTEIQSVTYAEDSGHASGDPGLFALAVRNDANAVLTSTDLDYSPIAVDSSGRLKVIASISGSYAEDSAHTSGDLGLFTLMVRNDADTSLVNANGDYAPTQVDALGRLKTVSRANVSNLQQVVSVATTATLLPATALANRQNILIQNQGSSSIFIGSATVTAAGATKGIEVPKGGSMMVDAGPTNVIYGICASGTVAAGVWELS